MTESRMADSREVTGPHRPIMVAEVLAHLRPAPGETFVDCTLGGGGHARAIMERLRPCGRLVGLDVDPIELPRTEARLRGEGFGDTLRVHRRRFTDLPAVLAEEGIAAADGILVDLGVSAMQHDTPDRGFSYKHHGPLDLRMDPTSGEPAAQRLSGLDEASLARVLADYSDEPHAATIAAALVRQPVPTTHALDRLVRRSLAGVDPGITKAAAKMSVRRTFQALRILVNDELAALDALLHVLPACLAPGGRVVVLTFHSGEDRRVKQAFRTGWREGVYAGISRAVVRSAKDETFANRRAAAAKLRWAVKR